MNDVAARGLAKSRNAPLTGLRRRHRTAAAGITIAVSRHIGHDWPLQNRCGRREGRPAVESRSREIRGVAIRAAVRGREG